MVTENWATHTGQKHNELNKLRCQRMGGHGRRWVCDVTGLQVEFCSKWQNFRFDNWHSLDMWPWLLSGTMLSSLAVLGCAICDWNQWSCSLMSHSLAVSKHRRLAQMLLAWTVIVAEMCHSLCYVSVMTEICHWLCCVNLMTESEETSGDYSHHIKVLV